MVRDRLRQLLRFKKPRNQHEQLFGLLGASGPRVLAYALQLIFFVSTIALATNLSLINWPIVASWTSIESVTAVRALALLPSLIIFLLMPGLVLSYSYATSTQDLTRGGLLKEVSNLNPKP